MGLHGFARGDRAVTRGGWLGGRVIGRGRDGGRGGRGRSLLGFLIACVLLEAGELDRWSRPCVRATIQIINNEGYYLIVNYDLLSDAGA